MSLLSTPTARPERVYSLVSLVRALGGRVKISDAKEWLAPEYRSSEPATPKDGERVREVYRVAKDLQLLDADKDEWVSTGVLPDTRRALARHVHRHLSSLKNDDPDAVLLRAYAWCVAFAEGNGTAALVAKSSSELANDIDAALGRNKESDDEKVFNTTKLPAWKDWMVFLGLGWNDLPGTTGFLLDPSRRLEEDTTDLISTDSKMDAAVFIAAVAKAFPYLDGGELFKEACGKGLSGPPTGRLSRVLSQTLRVLDENAILRCSMEGDSKRSIGLFPNPLSSTNGFSHIERVQGKPHV